MKIKRLLFTFTYFFLAIVSIFAQNTIIKGKVTGDGEPLIGATVKVKEKPEIGTITDTDGNFTILLPMEGKSLSVSFLGFQPQNVEIGNKTKLTINLLSSDKGLDEVVVVGYGSMKKRDLTGSISSVSSDAIEARSAVNAFDALQGQVAGVQVTNSGGTPGSAPDIRVRGTSTFGDGYKPLYVVDGAIQDNINDLNPSDIKSMEVLKDAASAAIYGSRSGNGVILITTKSGILGMPKLELKYLHSFGKLGRILPHSTLSQRAWYDKQRKLMGASYFTFTDSLSAYGNSDVDIFKEMFNISQRDQIDFNISGATDKANYFIGTGFYNEKGIIINSGYQRLSWRMNADYNFSPKVTFGTRVSMSYSSRYGLSEGSASINELMNRTPYYPIYNPDGTFVGNMIDHANPVAVAKDGINQTQIYIGNNLNYLEIKILPTLTFKTNLQATFVEVKSQSRLPQNQVGINGLYMGTDNDALNYSYANENYFNYSLKALNYNFTAMLGASAQAWGTYNTNLRGLNYASDAIYTLNSVSSFDTKNTYTTISRHTMASAFTRITYSYKNKYMFNSNIREDGSSRFGTSTKWGLFPSVSLAWRLSEERFMKPLKKITDNAKLRISWGITGNEAIGNYDAQQLYSTGSIYDGIAGIASSGLSNPYLSWEKTKQYNGGLDLNLFRSKVRITFDVYLKNTSNLLYNVPLPSETGFTRLRQNIGAMKSTGLEFNLDASLLKTKDWQWTLNLNVSKNNSTIVTLANGVPFYQGANNAIYVQENGRVGEIYGYKFLGVFAYDQSNAFTPDYKQQLTPVFVDGVFQNSYLLNGQSYTGEIKHKYDNNGTTLLKGGDINFQDVDGDGVITIKDKVFLGCAQPLVSGGFNSTLNYKSFAVTASFIYSLGGSMYNNAEASRDLTTTLGNTPSPAYIDNMWLKQGDVTNYHAPTSNILNNRQMPSSFYVESASYVRLKSLRFSYDIPNKITKKILTKDLSIYIYGNNLLTFTKFSGFDPEIPSSGGALAIGVYNYSYPQKKELGFGCNVNF